MHTVNLVYALIQHGDKILLGVTNTVEGAVDLIKKSGYGFHLSEHELSVLRVLRYTINSEVNFKIETWQVN